MKDNSKLGFKGLFLKFLPFVIAFFLPSALLFIAYAIFKVYPFGDGSVLVLDLNGQYVYYYEALKNALFGDGSIFYSFSRNMSGDFFGICAYYLASPFSLIPTLLPRSVITEGILIMQMCKVGACSVTFSYYLNKTKRADSLSGILFGTMYGLMSYVVVQLMNPMWIDGVVYLPLIILGIEELVKDKRILPFAIPTGLMFIANFYIGYMVGIFAALYFVIFAAGEGCFFSIKKLLDRGLRALIGAIIAVLIGAITILPIYKILSLGKMEFSTPPTYEAYDKFPIAQVLGKLLPFSYDSVNVQGLPFIYCGVLTLILFPAYFAVKNISIKKKITSAITVGVSFILMYVSTFDLLMHGGQWPNWLNYRYSFVFSFLILTLGAEALNNIKNINRASLFKVYGAIIVLMIFFKERWTSYISDIYTYWFTFIALSLYLAILLIIRFKPGIKKVALICCIVFVSCELVFNSYNTFEKIDDEVLYSTRPSYTDWLDEFSPVVEYIKDNDDSLYRMDTTYHRTVNDPMALNIYGISHSSSLMNTKILDFLGNMGYTSRGFESRYIGGTIVSDSLIGIKYVIAEWEDQGAQVVPKRSLTVFDDLYNEIYDNGYVIHAYENPYALPIAFYADNALSQVYFDTADENNVFDNQNRLLSGIMGEDYTEYLVPCEYEMTLNNVTEYDAIDQMRYVPTDSMYSASVDYTIKSDISGELYMYIPTHYHRSATVNYNGKVIREYFADDYHTSLGLGKVTKGKENRLSLIFNEEDIYMQEAKFYVLDEEKFAKAIEKIRSNPSEVIKKDEANLTVNLTAPKAGYVYTSIPYQKGWTVKIDGKKVEPICVADSLMAIPISEGEHTVTLKFVTDGFVLGLALTIFGILICIAIIVYKKKFDGKIALKKPKAKPEKAKTE